MDIKLMIKEINQTIKLKLLDIKQLEIEHRKIIKEIIKLNKTALYGKIININKWQQPCVDNDFKKTVINVYRQFVAKRENGKQKKVYLGKDLVKEQQYQECLDDGDQLLQKIERQEEIEQLIFEFSQRINPSYIY